MELILKRILSKLKNTLNLWQNKKIQNGFYYFARTYINDHEIPKYFLLTKRYYELPFDQKNLHFFFN